MSPVLPAAWRVEGSGLCRVPLWGAEVVCVALARCDLNSAAFLPQAVSACLQGVIPCTPLSSRWFLHLPAGLISSTCIKMKYFIPLGSKLRKWGAGPPHCEEELMGRPHPG